MNRQLLSIFIVFAIFATYNCAHLKSQANLAQSQEESYDSENFNFFQQSQIKEDYETEDFNFLQQEQEESYDSENFNFLQQEQEEEETYEPEDFNFLQQQEEDYEVEEFDFDANLLQTQGPMYVKRARIAFDKYNVPNVFIEQELPQFKSYNTKVLSIQMRIFSGRYNDKMIALIRLKKRDRQSIKYVTVPFQQQENGFYWYKKYGYSFDKVIGYVYGRDSFPTLRNNPKFTCLISVFNKQYKYGGVFPAVYMNQFLQRNRSFTWIKSSMCLPK
ncbi:hypothetical protein PPERSA_10431 [Pseudocohnilembus persalinus]|uniref:Uncharacterized protein n=1 Tax=Pseudocohnilembus persalinus TaxID=266149 RepID=A0A0V0QWW4_PSEPJ|nr:hypothetical protein PPERSA_10431 [Pseudocohnilembus persalinus]|eukprot:KRX06573.1 hypothetical protein PPERSA_10431 [Pseudocohnilembus persalinus]